MWVPGVLARFHRAELAFYQRCADGEKAGYPRFKSRYRCGFPFDAPRDPPQALSNMNGRRAKYNLGTCCMARPPNAR